MKLKSLMPIAAQWVKEMLRGINLNNRFDLLRVRGKGSKDARREDFLSDHFSPEEDKEWQRAMEGYPIGRILAGLKVITPDQLDEALKKQWELQSIRKRKSLGIILMEMWHTTSKVYLERLSQYFDMPVLSLRNFIPIPSLQELVGLKYAYRHRVIIVGRNESEVRVALDEPNPVILEELKKSFGRKKVNFYLANPFEVERCLKGHLDPYSGNFYR